MKYILAINSGSATLKVKVFDEKLKEVFKAQMERVGLPQSFLVYQKNKRINFSAGINNHQRALKEIIKVLPDIIYRGIKLAGHRIVHGGEDFVEPTVLNKTILKQIGKYNDFAPIHNPINLKTALAAIAEFPNARQIGVFDTQFFKDLPEYTYLYSIPVKYYQRYGLRKYGFHGLSHENMFQEAAARLGRKNLNLITCHLGNGASVTVIKAGKALDTSMGLTPLAGITMGARSGDLDPYIPLFLVKELKMPPDQVYKELNFNSGLKGICGLADFRDILAVAGVKVPGYKLAFKPTRYKKELAKLALRIYLYDVQRYVASYSGLLGRVDAVVFSGGVGQNSQIVRELIVSGVYFINRPKILAIKSNEELLIARKIVKFLEK
ncbi:acetate/propionate family kinase [Patescibacteria group bacterium]|nr:acetate/propionate family kinase [Patescibacteria group bacterium]